MPFRSVANPTELAMLEKLLTDHCDDLGFDTDDPLRLHVAERLMKLFASGVIDTRKSCEKLSSTSKRRQPPTRATVAFVQRDLRRASMARACLTPSGDGRWQLVVRRTGLPVLPDLRMA